MPDDMPMTPVPQSSNVASVGTEGDDLIVQFKGGGQYRYAGAASDAANLLNSPSPGSYLWRHIKDRYPAAKE